MGVGVVFHGCGWGEWEDDTIRGNNNFNISLANKTIEKLAMGVYSIVLPLFQALD